MAVLWLLVGLLVSFAIYSYFIEPRQLRLTQRTVSIPRLPPELDGLRIAHFSDLHVKSELHPFQREMAQQVVSRALAMDVDLVCLTGDLAQASRHVPHAARVLQPLAGKPVFVVMGNHDHDKMLESEFMGRPEEGLSAREWCEIVEAAGLRTLQNECAEAVVRGRRVVVMGVGDPSCGWDDLSGAMAGCAGADLHLLLVHSPDLVDDPRTDWADLVLCGHTHGGQLQLPGIGSPWAPVWRDRRRADGMFRIGETVCHVTRGVGAGIRARFLCWPELCVLTLRQGQDDRLRRLPRLTRTMDDE